MNFSDEINELEKYNPSEDYKFMKGNIPILISAAHTMNQVKEDGSIKLSEPYTKAIALYLNKYYKVHSLIKFNDTGMDSNRDNRDEYKKELIRYVKDNNIRLVIDIHGALSSRNFDIEFGTLNNLSSDDTTLKELSEAFSENGIKNIEYNNPFKGGAITTYLTGIKDVDAIQIEINGRYRDKNNLDLLEKLIISFENFIKQYNEYISR